MRIGLALLVVLSVAAPASADSKVKNLIKFYNKEAMVCAKYAQGIASAKERAEPYVDDAEIKADVDKLGQVQVVVRDYCDAIDATIAILDPNASYKSLQAEIDKHDAVVRAGREATKDALEESNVVIQRLIPKVNKRRANS
ncbi:MAG TPA: hypothetical protein VFV99_11450 [Kofleriaceae bacterium]|nr:hypothetical protein [Kofleriaceae bacterium]